MEGEPDFNDDLANRINDIILLAFYFIELTPSLVIIVVLWKSNNELKMKQTTVFHNTSISNPNETNSFPKTDSVERLLDECSSSDVNEEVFYAYNSHKKSKRGTETDRKRSTKVKTKGDSL